MKKNARYYRPLCMECITPHYFPDVALYLRSGGNYVLYKPQERKFTEDDQARLKRTRVDTLYVRSGDMEEITEFLEKNLGEMLTRDDIGSRAKGQILYQTSINYLNDVFETPEKSFNITRCRSLVRNLMKFVAGREDILESLNSVIGHNHELFVHSVQVAALTMLVHDEIYKLQPHEMIDVGVGALLHDIGMVFIATDLLDNDNALSDLEYYKLKQHPQKGFEHLSASGIFTEISLSVIHHHHERQDGRGFPTGIKGDAISRSAQVAAICDVYCTMTTQRESSPATPPAQALKTMREEAKGAFNAELFERFAQVVTALKGDGVSRTRATTA